MDNKPTSADESAQVDPLLGDYEFVFGLRAWAQIEAYREAMEKDQKEDQPNA